MPEQNAETLDLDYILMAAALAGCMTAIATAATLIARPSLMELGKQLPLPSLNVQPETPDKET
ncbi:MAG: hypothetical protein U9R15_08705 [Chloroflexota bacterium]|nr:hypothetical protein [Chloroflexota bacterium]